jgi:hypothetical protein
MIYINNQQMRLKFMMYLFGICLLFIIYCCLQRYVVKLEKRLRALSKCHQCELFVDCSIEHLFNVTRRGVFGG